MTATDVVPPGTARPRSAMVRRLRDLVGRGTTEMAGSVLRVPLSYYRDPDLAAAERAAIMATPLALVPSALVPGPHHHAVRDVLGTSILVSRSADGRARAFLNYCRHRGAQVAAPGSCGTARRLACPYHGWTYDSGGDLVGIPGAEGFAGLDRHRYGLVPLPTEERAGFVWVVPTAGAPLDLDGHLGPLAPELAGFGLERYEHLTTREFTAPVNWKAALEAFAETYHFPYVHGSSIVGANTVANTSTYDPFGRHHRLGFACRWIDGAPDLDEHPDPLSYMVFVYWVYPNLVVAFSAVGVELIDILPGPVAQSCRVRHGWMAAVPPADDAARQGFAALFEQVHAAVRDEDFGMLPGCGEAIVHGQHDHMLVGRNEIGVQHVVRTLAGTFGVELPAG